MKRFEDSELMRIFINENEKYKGAPLYEVIVKEAHKRGLAGATVLRGIMGYGADSRFHTSKILRLSEDLPIVIEIADQLEKIESFLPFLDEVIKEGFATVEKVRVNVYKKGG